MVLSRKEFVDKARRYSFGLRKLRFYLLLFFTLTMPLVIHLGNTEYGYTKTIYTFAFVSFLVLLWLGELLVNEKKKISLTSLSIPIAVLLLSGLLSLINAPSKGAVLQSLALLVYFYLIYLVIANTIRNKSEVMYLLIALVAATLGASIYGILQYFGIARGAQGFTGGAGNIISVLGNQNYLGGFISYVFIPAFALTLVTRSKLLKSFLIFSLGVFFFILFPIGARGAWLSLISGFLISGALFLYFKPKIAVKAFSVTLFALVVVLLLAYLFASAPGPLNSVLTYSAPEDGEATWGIFTPVIRPLVRELVEEGGARVEDWYIGWEMFKEHPLIGIGLGNYKIKFLDYRSKFLSSNAGEGFGQHIPRGAQAHNEYVQFAAELGGFGVFAILFGLGFLLYDIYSKVAATRAENSQLIGIALIAGLTGFLIHSAVSFPAHLPASSFTFVAFLGLLNSRAFGEMDYRVSLSKISRYVLFGLVAVAVVSVSTFAYRDWRANVLRGKGETQLQFGHYKLAKNYFQDSLKRDFQPRHTYYLLGIAERKLGNQKEALKYFKKARGQFEPYNLFLHLGTLYLQQGELDKAKENLEKLISMGPEQELILEGKYYLAAIAVRQEKLDKAKGLLEDVIQKDKYNDQARFLLGDIANFRGNEEAAKKIWEQTLKIINEKLEQIEQRLSGEVSRNTYNDLTSQKENLKGRKERLRKKLNKI